MTSPKSVAKEIRWTNENCHKKLTEHVINHNIVSQPDQQFDVNNNRILDIEISF